MEIEGRIIKVFDAIEGISKATGKEWKKQEYLLQTEGQYPKNVLFDIFGADKIAQANIQENEELTVSIDLDSREYNGRWYTSVRAWKVDRKGAGVPAATQVVGAGTPAPTVQAATSDDLPF